MEHLDSDPLWYKDAIIYELHVRAFYDSNGDGIGDFQGLVQKLDYLQDLGITTIWLLPFCPSPLRDDGYDIADYTNINPSYGTKTHFKSFVREAHRRGLRVITELVINHTSDQHPWFQRARKAPVGSSFRDFYVWSDTPDRYADTRIIFKDTEHSNWTWDPIAKAYYWHRFFSHQPDLNFDNPEVHKALFTVLDFWLDLGVDGLRLDAVPYLYEREGTHCENLPETHDFLKKLRAHVDEKYDSRMLLAEANQWPEDAAAYFGEGDECHMNFHFPLMPRLFMAIQMEDRFPIIDILDQTPAIPENCQWGVFLRNHDELTLEMVTDEERDYMYRVFAHDQQARINLGIRRRLAPLLGNDRKKIELIYSLLFSMPGTPVLYYGEEIGMGDNFYLGDRNGVRTPMQWSADRNAGFSGANPQKLYLPIIIDPEYHYEAVNVELQQNNAQSLLWWMKRILSLRKQFPVFGRGSLEFLHPANRKVLVFLRRYQDETLLVAVNLSRHAQWVELDLSEFKGCRPLTLFGQSQFPAIGDLPYLLTLGGHTFYWFLLEQVPIENQVSPTQAEPALPVVTIGKDWTHLFGKREKGKLEKVLPDYIKHKRWFGGKAKKIQFIEIAQAIPLPTQDPITMLSLLRVEYTEGETENYLLPLRYLSSKHHPQLPDPKARIAHVRIRDKQGEEEGLLIDALWDVEFQRFLLTSMAKQRRFANPLGQVITQTEKPFRNHVQQGLSEIEPMLLRGEQSNTSLLYGDRYILKLYRRVETGMNPDLEISRFLTQKKFEHTSGLTGSIEFHPKHGDPLTFGILQQYVQNEGDAWKYTLDELGRYFEEALTQPSALTTSDLPQKSLLALADEDIPPTALERVGPYLEEVRLLGQRTGELHVTLASDQDLKDFSPEVFTEFHRRGLYQSMLGTANVAYSTLRSQIKSLPEPIHALAKNLLGGEKTVRTCLGQIRDRKFKGCRIRCHGDFHLGQVLFTGKDFVIIDFEGEPARPLSVRKLKDSPLRDVAGMLRSFHYAAQASSLGLIPGVRPEDSQTLSLWARYWQTWVSVSYLKAYLNVSGLSTLLPPSPEDLAMLLKAYVLQKALYELTYELNNRADWALIPLDGLYQILKSD